MAVGDRVEQFRALAKQAFADLLDQREPFGRLALVQVLMLAGDTLIAISLAGSLFFSISPHQAKGKVLLYLLLTLAPFAVVSPLLGPLIDRSRGARRAMAVASAVGRAVLCPFMARDIHTLLLFPEAFLVLVLSKLWLVTRGALVPEMMAMGPPPKAAGAGEQPSRLGEETQANPTMRPIEDPSYDRPTDGSAPGYAALNARLTLLGTLAGFVASVPAIALYKLAGDSSAAVLILATFVFVGAAFAAVRLPIPRVSRLPGVARPSGRGPSPPGTTDFDADLIALQPNDPEVLLGLSTNSLLRGITGFFVFMLAFGLRRLDAPLYWYGLALGASGVGSLVGLALVPRLRRRISEPQILTSAVWLVAIGASVAAVWGSLFAQVVFAFTLGVAGSWGQPSFDAITQHFVPEAQQGRAFARFATRQQLVWVAGALIPVAITLPLAVGDVIIAAAAAAGALFYMSSRRALRHRALPRRFRRYPGHREDPGGLGQTR
jgi:Transmembrane secretion effector